MTIVGSRLAVSVTAFLLMATWEAAQPHRSLVVARTQRWTHNLGLMAMNTALLSLLPVTAVMAASWADHHGIGLLHQLSAPLWVEGLVAVVLLDLAIYLQHRAFHAVPMLWRLHAVHHADPEMDVSTATRFHTVEMALSMLLKVALVVGLGASVVAVVVFEMLLHASATFNHANIALPRALSWVEWLLVTPGMHRVHHSVDAAEHHSNFGFSVPWWDWLGGTWRAGRPGVVLGLPGMPEGHQTLPWMLAFPWMARLGR